MQAATSDAPCVLSLPALSISHLRTATFPHKFYALIPLTHSVHDLLAHAAGHSLGGALATLAAHSFATRARQEGATPAVTCYTFGSPRAGNHAFAAEYNQLVPDTWHVINDQVGTLHP